MQLDQLDIEAIANSRMARREQKKSSRIMQLVLLGMAIGCVLMFFVNNYVGVAVIVVTLICFMYYNSTLNKKKESMRVWLVNQWRKEQIELKNSQVNNEEEK